MTTTELLVDDPGFGVLESEVFSERTYVRP